uniref:Uncharacterized protein n=1 Tax=Arundo donax TaxID=35708 RepID=A0A0A8ZHE8_ARUDO
MIDSVLEALTQGGSGEGLYKASLTPTLYNVERLCRTQDLISGVTYHCTRPALGRLDNLNDGHALIVRHFYIYYAFVIWLVM